MCVHPVSKQFCLWLDIISWIGFTFFSEVLFTFHDHFGGFINMTTLETVW